MIRRIKLIAKNRRLKRSLNILNDKDFYLKNKNTCYVCKYYKPLNKSKLLGIWGECSVNYPLMDEEIGCEDLTLCKEYKRFQGE